MEEKTSTLTMRLSGAWQNEVAVPEIGATKTTPTLDSALAITLHEIVKHLTTHFLVLVFVESQEQVQPDGAQQAAFEDELEINVAVPQDEAHDGRKPTTHG